MNTALSQVSTSFAQTCQQVNGNLGSLAALQGRVVNGPSAASRLSFVQVAPPPGPHFFCCLEEEAAKDVETYTLVSATLASARAQGTDYSMTFVDMGSLTSLAPSLLVASMVNAANQTVAASVDSIQSAMADFTNNSSSPAGTPLSPPSFL